MWMSQLMWARSSGVVYRRMSRHHSRYVCASESAAQHWITVCVCVLFSSILSHMLIRIIYIVYRIILFACLFCRFFSCSSASICRFSVSFTSLTVARFLIWGNKTIHCHRNSGDNKRSPDDLLNNRPQQRWDDAVWRGGGTRVFGRTRRKNREKNKNNTKLLTKDERIHYDVPFTYFQKHNMKWMINSDGRMDVRHNGVCIYIVVSYDEYYVNMFLKIK